MLTSTACGQGQSSVTTIELITAFKLRVSADSGVYQNEACQIITLNIINV